MLPIQGIASTALRFTRAKDGVFYHIILSGTFLNELKTHHATQLYHQLATNTAVAAHASTDLCLNNLLCLATYSSCHLYSLTPEH